MKRLLSVMILPLVLVAQSAPNAHSVIAFDSFLPPEFRESLARQVARLYLESPAGMRLTVLDGSRLQTVADTVIPEGSPRLRQQRLLPEIGQVVRAIRGATNEALPFNAPRLLDHVALQLRIPGEPLNVYLLGPSLYHNPQEPAFDMARHWPSDGHLQAGFERSIFSTVERAHRLDAVRVFWCVKDLAEAVTDAHREGVLRFWTLFVGTQGGMLAAFSPDVPGVFGRASDLRMNPVLQVQPDPRDTNVVMRTRKLEIPRQEERPGPSLPLLAVELPRIPAGNTGIGIVWSNAPVGAVDLDLYVQPPPGGPELSFSTTSSAFGRYFRDIRQSLPATGDWRTAWEFVELNGDALPREVWVNLFSGTGPVQGELRLERHGQLHRVQISFPATAGDSARGRNRRDEDPAWIKIKLDALGER